MQGQWSTKYYIETWKLRTNESHKNLAVFRKDKKFLLE